MICFSHEWVCLNLRGPTLAVVIFDWVLPFSSERQIMWTRPWTGTKILFLLNRYSFIGFYIPQIMSDIIPQSLGGVRVFIQLVWDRIKTFLYLFVEVFHNSWLWIDNACWFSISSCPGIGNSLCAFSVAHNLGVSGTWYVSCPLSLANLLMSQRSIPRFASVCN